MSAKLRPGTRVGLLAALLVGVLAAIVSIAAPHLVVLRAVLGLPFLVLGPGYALTQALYARDQPRFSMQVLLTLGLSVAAIVLAGLVLNAVGIALTGHAFVLTQLGITACACAVAVARSDGQYGSGPSIAPATVLRSPWLLSVTALVVVFAALLVGLARPLPDPAYAGYTQLSGLRQGADVDVAVSSAEHRLTRYRLTVRAASGRTVSRDLALPPGGQWTDSVHVGAPLEQTVRVQLERASSPGVVYREVILRA